MNVNDLVLTETKTGVRIHRASCKRRGNAVPLAKVLDFAPGTAAKGTSASCCKPKGVKELLADIPVEAPAGNEPESTLRVSYVGLPKHFWTPLANLGAESLVDRLGGDKVSLQTNRASLSVTLTGPEEDVHRLGSIIQSSWHQAMAALKEYKKTDEGKPAVAKAGGYKIWDNFLLDFCVGKGDELAGKPQSGYSAGCRAGAEYASLI